MNAADQKQLFPVDLVKVRNTLEANQGKSKTVPEAFGVSKEFEDNFPIRKIAARCVEFDDRSQVLQAFIDLALEYCTTDEEYIYFLYYAIMHYAMEFSSRNPLAMLLSHLGNLGD